MTNVDPGTEIVVVLPSLRAGGTERVAINVVNYWAAQGHHPVLVLFSYPAEVFFDLDPSIDVVHLFSDRQTLNRALFGETLSHVRQLREVILNRKAKIVLGFLPQINIAVVLSAWRLNVRTIISERNNLKQRKIGVFWDMFRKVLYRYATVVTINSEINRPPLESFVPKEKILYLPNPIKFPRIDVPAEKKKVVLAVGRLTSQKGFDILIQSFAKSQMPHEEWQLVICGDGPQKDELVKLIEQENVTGSITIESPTKYVWQIYSFAQIFVMASRYEGTPNALLEALSTGLIPVVCEGVGELAQEIQTIDEKLACENDSVLALADSLNYAISRLAYLHSLAGRFRQIAVPFEEANAMQDWDSLLTAHVD